MVDYSSTPARQLGPLDRVAQLEYYARQIAASSADAPQDAFLAQCQQIRDVISGPQTQATPSIITVMTTSVGMVEAKYLGFDPLDVPLAVTPSSNPLNDYASDDLTTQAGVLGGQAVSPFKDIGAGLSDAASHLGDFFSSIFTTGLVVALVIVAVAVWWFELRGA